MPSVSHPGVTSALYDAERSFSRKSCPNYFYDVHYFRCLPIRLVMKPECVTKIATPNVSSAFDRGLQFLGVREGEGGREGENRDFSLCLTHLWHVSNEDNV